MKKGFNLSVSFSANCRQIAIERSCAEENHFASNLYVHPTLRFHKHSGKIKRFMWRRDNKNIRKIQPLKMCVR